MERYLRVLSTVCLALLLTAGAASAQQGGDAPAQPAAFYSSHFVAHAVDRFYRVFGELPQNWAQVRRLGLYENELVGPGGQLIDPDDGRLDFPGDVYLRRSGSRIALYRMEPDGSESRELLRAQDTYDAQFEQIRLTRNLVPEHDQRLRRYRNDTNKQLQFAHVGQINEAIEDYFGVYGQYPDSMDDLFASGFSPINEDTINPVTGEPYRFDGSPGNLRLNAQEQFSAVIHVDEDGLISTAIDY